MKEYKYIFSVIMPVYKVEPWLREAVDSLIHQTLGFSNIQLILVDDGSPDNCGAICDEYKQRYPENVVVVHKENGGVSSARNAGIPLAEGRYLNFMDSDDRMEHDAFKKVAEFFAEHAGETDVVAIPLKYFDGRKGNHSQNHKFSHGKTVIDLYQYPYIRNLFTNSTFFTAESIEGVYFDTHLTKAEDAKFAISVLLRKMKLGLVPDTVYWYRIRSDGEASALQAWKKKVSNYIPYLKHFSIAALNMSADKFGVIPQFVQYEVMHDLQWLFIIEQIPEGVLTDQEQKDFHHLLVETTSRIDDNVISMQTMLPSSLKAYVLQAKHASNASAGKDIPSYGLECANTAATALTAWDFLAISEDGKSCVAEGYHALYGIEPSEVEPCLIVNGETVSCEKIDRPYANYKFLGEKIGKTVGFRATFPLGDNALTISPALRRGEKVTEVKNAVYNQFFPVSDRYKNAYAVIGSRLLTLNDGKPVIRKKPSFKTMIAREIRFLYEAFKKNPSANMAQVIGRMLYHVRKPFKRRQLWLVSDNYHSAGDNGEAMFRYIRQEKPKNVKAVYVISKNSVHYDAMRKIGKCIEPMSRQHKLMFLLCDMNISSHANDNTINPFGKHIDLVRDLMHKHHYIFLQHGIIKDDLSDWLERYKKSMCGFITSAYGEHNSIVNGSYGYPADSIWLTGLPRYDRLYRNNKKWITIMPTWRRYLMDITNKGTGTFDVITNFEEQAFFRFYDELLNSERLLDGLEQYGYSLKFLPHPRMLSSLHLFRKNSRVEFLNQSISYRDVFAKSSLLVTDYSSTVFDFAYLREPVVYCHFDKDEFFSGKHTYTKGYYDYERDGFGEVTYDIEQLIDTILEYAANGCKLKDRYRERIDKFFAFNDQNNCRRVLDKILALPKKH